MPAQLAPTECQRIDAIVRGKKLTATDALAETNRARKRRGVEPIALSAVSRYRGGQTHRRDAEEARGRPVALTRAQIRVANLARKRLVKQADNERRVTWDMVIEEAGLGDAACRRVICDTLR